MKKILLGVAFFTFVVDILGQGNMPINQPMGNANTETYTNGLQGATYGYRFRTLYADTTALNLAVGGILKTIPRVLASAGNKLYMRDNTAQYWIEVGSGGGSSGWNLTGNTGTTAGINYLGTSDAVNLQLRTNSLKRFTINTNGAFGLGTGEDYGTANYIMRTNGSSTAPTWVNSGDLNPIDVYLIAGQSNAVGVGTSSLSPSVTAGTVYQYNAATGLTAGNDPIGSGTSVAITGSAWPAFGIHYYTLTNRKVCFVAAAVSGSSQTVAAASGFGNWDTTGVLFDTSVARTQAAMTYLAANGYTPNFKGILWCQGENDANAINAATITQADYIAAFRKMIGRYRTSFGVRIPFYIFRTGTRVGFSDVGYSSVRDAQNTVSNADSITNIVFWNAINFPSRGLMIDAYHYTQAGYNEMGRIGAEEVVNAGSTRFQPQANNLYFNKGNIGIGTSTAVGVPTSKLYIDNGTSAFNPLYITANTNTGNSSVRIENTNAGTGALTAARFYNNSGLTGQVGVGSSTYFFGGNKIFLQGITDATVVSALTDIEFAHNPALTTYARFKNNGHLLLNTSTDVVNKVLVVNGSSYFGDTVSIGNATPTEKLDITGNVRFSGALMPNNDAGTSSKILIGGTPPTWSSSLPSSLVPNWQTTLIAGSTLTQNNTILGGGNEFIFSNLSRFRAATATYPNGLLQALDAQGFSFIGDYNADVNNTYLAIEDSRKRFFINSDSVNILKPLGQSSNSGDSIVVRNSSSGRLKTIAQSAVGGGVSSLSAIGSTPNANGGTITGSTLNLEPASASFGGVIKGSGSQTLGAVLTMPTPIFTTSAQVPLLIGGTGTTSTLTYKTTTGVGASGADHIFQVGNNGATEAMRIRNDASVLVAGNVGSASGQANFVSSNNNFSLKNGFYYNFWLTGSGTDKRGWATEWSGSDYFASSQIPYHIGGFGTTPAAMLQATSTTEQLRLSYNASNYVSYTVSSGGNLTVSPTGTTMTIAAAKALNFASGTNTRAGNATLVAGTVTVSNTTVTANTIVILTRKTSGGTVGTSVTYTLSAGTSFTITSDNVLDTSTFSYILIENS